MHKRHMDKAEDLLRTALRINPDHPTARLNLGLLYLATGHFEWAADHLRDMTERFPNNLSIRNNLAVALMRIGEYDASREHLLMREDPERDYAYFNMAITYALEQRFKEAFVWIDKGAEHCSPIAFRRFMSDPDFNELRKQPAFQERAGKLYAREPKVPEGIK